VPTLTLPIDPEGVLVDVEVAWSSVEVRVARQSGRPIPPSVRARALIDTGADASCLDSTIVQQLGLPFGGLSMTNVPALGGVTFSPAHDVSLTVLHPSGNNALNLVLADLLVLDLDLATVGYQVLIGRDVLAWCRLLYDGLGARFKMRY